ESLADRIARIGHKSESACGDLMLLDIDPAKVKRGCAKLQTIVECPPLRANLVVPYRIGSIGGRQIARAALNGERCIDSAHSESLGDRGIDKIVAGSFILQIELRRNRLILD